jgi:hypothetical protein
MSEEAKVYVLTKVGRKNLYLRFTDPTTGKRVEKSAETSKRAEAVKAAGKWEAELREGRYQKRNRMTWEAFKEYYTANALPGLAARTQQGYETALKCFRAHLQSAEVGRRDNGARDGIHDCPADRGT